MDNDESNDELCLWFRVLLDCVFLLFICFAVFVVSFGS